MAARRLETHDTHWTGTHWLILGLLLAAFWLYVYAIDAQSLWRDEALSIGRARQPISLILQNRNLVQGVDSPDLHPPLYFLLLSGTRRLWGESEFAYRYPSVLAMLLALALVGALARRIWPGRWGRETAVYATFLAVVSPFYLWYAQEARMYTLVAFEAGLVLWTLWPLLRKTKQVPLERREHALVRPVGTRASLPPHDSRQASILDYVKFGLAAAVLVYTHYTGLFLLAFACAAYVVMRLSWRLWLRLLLVAGAVALLALPLYASLEELLTAGGFFAFTRRTLGEMLREAFTTFTLGSAAPPVGLGWRIWPYIGLALLGVAAVFWPYRAGITPRWDDALRRFWLTAGAFAGTLLVFYLSAYIQPNYTNPRHLMVLTVPLLLTLGSGVTLLRRVGWPLAAVGVLLVGYLGGTAVYETIIDPPLVRDDVRGLRDYVAKRLRPGDALIWHDAPMSVTYDYYAIPGVPYAAFPQFGAHDPQQIMQDTLAWTEPYERIWFVDSVADSRSVVKEWLQQNWVRQHFEDFPASWASLHLTLYTRPPVPPMPQEAQALAWQSHGYRLQGVVAADRVQAGDGLWVDLYWRSENAAAAGDVTACARLVDSQPVVWSEGCNQLTLAPVEKSNGLHKTQIWLEIPPGLAPIQYGLEIRVEDAVERVTDVTVTPADRVAEAKARFGSVSLLAAEWAAGPFRPGLQAVGHAIWRAEAEMPAGLQAAVRLVDWRGRVLSEGVQPLGVADYPAQAWRPGDAVRQNLNVGLPVDLNGRYRAQINVLNAAGEPLGEWTGTGRISIANWPLVTELPEGVEAAADEIVMAGAIQLAAYALEREGDQLYVNLYWRALREIDAGYFVFVHVARPGESPIAQADGVPAGQTRPVAGWRAGEIIADTYAITLPGDANLEAYSVLVGMFEPETGSRPALAINGEVQPSGSVNLGEVPP